MQPEIERRVLTGQAVELRATADGKPMLTGYAALYDAVSEPLGGFREVLRPGCFDAVMATSPDVLARAEHDSTLLLGRTSSGTCRLFLDARGLRYEVDLPDTTAGRDVEALVRRQDVKGSSFAFMVAADGQTWTTDARGEVLREITRVTGLIDVAPTCDPAYRQTSVSARALEEARSMSEQKKPEEKKADKAERRAAFLATPAEKRMLSQGSGYGCPCCQAGTCACCPEYSFGYGCACCASGACECCTGDAPCVGSDTCAEVKAEAAAEAEANARAEADRVALDRLRAETDAA